MTDHEPTPEQLARVMEIKAEIDQLLNEHMSIVNDHPVVNTGWMLVVRGASLNDNITHSSIITNENQDFISMLGFASFANLHVERRFYAG